MAERSLTERVPRYSKHKASGRGTAGARSAEAPPKRRRPDTKAAMAQTVRSVEDDVPAGSTAATGTGPAAKAKTAEKGAVAKKKIEQEEPDFSHRLVDSGEPALVDQAEVRHTLDLLWLPGQVTEVRALEAKLVTEARWAPTTLSGYFDDADALIESLDTIHSAKGIYLVLNPVAPALLARAANRIKRAGKGELTSDRDITTRRWLPIDCDAVRPSGISATDAEHEAALTRAMVITHHLRERGWPEPIIADSGNGGHLLYPIDLSADDGGAVERCLKALDKRFSDGVVKIDATVHNPARIWKLYGTAACKGDHTVERPHRMSRILSVPKTW